MADLSVTICGIEFPNPVLTAAGPNVRTGAMMQKAVDGGAGGVVAKTISVNPADDPRPTIRRTASNGLMNCETWSEIPAEEYLDECRVMTQTDVPLIVSIGYSPEDVRRLGPWIEKEISPAAIEFSTHYTGRDISPLLNVARSLRDSVSVPIWMKVSPGVPDIENLVVRAAPLVDGFVAINSYGPVLDFDVDKVGPRLGSDGGQGWLSGPPIQPIALGIVHQIASVQDKPVLGVGGIEKGTDALKFLMAGASAVQVCSAAILRGHNVYGKIASEINDWLNEHNFHSVSDVRGMYGEELRKRRHFARTPRMTIDQDLCTGCKACLGRCIQGSLYLDDDKVKVIPENCIGCGFCQDFCRFDAMELQESS